MDQNGFYEGYLGMVMLANRALEDVLGLDGPVKVEPEELAKGLRITRFPLDTQETSPREEAFAEELVDAFEEAGCEIVPYEDTLTALSFDVAFKWFKRAAIRTLKSPFASLTGSDADASYKDAKRPTLRALFDVRLGDLIKPGHTVLNVGEGQAGNLPVDYMADFQDISVLTLIDKPEHVEKEMPFTEHYETAIELFAHHMTHVVVGVDDEAWFLYNFNGSHPFYARDGQVDEHVLRSLIPKLAAPIRPPDLANFDVREEAFDPTDELHAPIVDELVASANVLDDSGLYPPGKDLEELDWRNEFYRWAGKIHLDDRTGMSYGFLARQMPSDLSPVWTMEEATSNLEGPPPEPGTARRYDVGLVATLDTPLGPRVVQVPPVRVMTLRSGCDKTNPDPETDLVMLGLVDGQMIMETPKGTLVEDGYRPSFDTKVILAHAVGNALVASVLDAERDDALFPRQLETEGMALAHWHGYVNPDHVLDGWHVHGADKLPVSCGTPHAGMFALDGKLESFANALENDEAFLGDIHIEPQHGTNLTHHTLEDIGRYLTKSDDVAGLGNKHLDAYKKRAKKAPKPPA